MSALYWVEGCDRIASGDVYLVGDLCHNKQTMAFLFIACGVHSFVGSFSLT